MPIVIDGYLTVAADALIEHEGHALLTARRSDGLVALQCLSCHDTHDPIEIAREHRSPATLPCGCYSQREHDEGAAIQAKLRTPRDPENACIGCLIGDDGLSVHSCAVHPRAAWPRGAS